MPDALENAVDEHVGKKMRLQAEREQLGVHRVVVMLLEFEARVFQRRRSTAGMPSFLGLPNDQFGKFD